MNSNWKLSTGILAGVFISLTGWAVPAGAAVYKYKSGDGKVHYSDSKSRIPEQYRDSATEVKPIESNAPVVPSPTAAPKAASSGKDGAESKGKVGIDVDADGNNKEFWMAKIKVLQDRQAAIEKRLKEIEGAGFVGNATPGAIKLTYDLGQEKEALEKELVEIPKKIGDIKEEARRKNAPPVWFR